MPTTGELAAHLLATAPDHEGWSIVESPNSFGKLEELLAWASGLDWMTWNTDKNIRQRELGLVLLWLESEVARQDGGEGSLWPILNDRDRIPWEGPVYTDLFSGGHATQLHRDLLRGAAFYYSLRNTFHEEDAQNWYRLIYLQFGFTHDDAVNRLDQWLSGHGLPVSIERLLGGIDSGAREFQSLWRSLRMFRLGNLTSETMDSRFRVNPWVLPEWQADLKRAALASSVHDFQIEDFEAAEFKFVTTPRLVWNEGRDPVFKSSICNLSGFDLVDSTYLLKIEDEVYARLIRQPDETYFSDTPEEEISLPIKPDLPVSLVSQAGSIIAHDQLKLWDLDEEASLYSANTGNQLPPDERLRAGTAVNLIVSQDVSVDPLPSEIWDLGLGYSLCRIQSGWESHIQVSLDDDLLWSSVAALAQGRFNPVGITAHFTSTLDLREGYYANRPAPWYLPIRITIPHRYRLERFRWRRGDGLLIERYDLPPELSLTETDAVKPVVLRIQVSENGRKQTEVIKVPVPFVAALKWLKAGGVYHHQPNRKLLLSDARSQAWSFSLPPENGQPRDPRKFSFLEGGILHGRLKRLPSALPDFVGLGAPLKVIEDKFNVIETIMDISPCVLDGGLLGSVQWLEEEDSFFIKTRFLELGDKHEFRVFKRDLLGILKIETIPWDNLELTEEGLFWHSWGGVSLYALSLFYEGTCVGSWFDFESWSIAVINNNYIPTPEMAKLVMEWKAPILQENGDHYHRITSWVFDNWVKVLPIWLRDSQNGQTRKWRLAVNELLLQSLPIPDAESADEVVEGLKDPGTEGVHALGSAVWKLVAVCPIITVRIVRIYTAEYFTNPDKQFFFACFLNLPEMDVSENRAEVLGRIHGNRDGRWLESTVPTLSNIDHLGEAAITPAFRLLSKSRDYRCYTLGRWLRAIQND